MLNFGFIIFNRKEKQKIDVVQGLSIRLTKFLLLNGILFNVFH